jgi:hypothetical protein
MRTELGRIDGDLEVVDGLVLVGSVSGSVSVRRGGDFTLAGSVSGDVLVEAGASADLMGMVGGDVRNAGGTLTVQGMVKGALRAEAGATRVDAEAIVEGGIEGPVETVKLSTYVPSRGRGPAA